jgi:hypothetical protein
MTTVSTNDEQAQCLGRMPDLQCLACAYIRPVVPVILDKGAAALTGEEGIVCRCPRSLQCLLVQSEGFSFFVRGHSSRSASCCTGGPRSQDTHFSSQSSRLIIVRLKERRCLVKQRIVVASSRENEGDGMGSVRVPSRFGVHHCMFDRKIECTDYTFAAYLDDSFHSAQSVASKTGPSCCEG